WVYVSIHEYGHAPVLGAIGISFLFVLTLSLVKAAGIYSIGKMSHWFGRNLLLLIIPFAWLVSEFAQRILFSGFPWLFAGYSQIDGPMWMLSTWLGVYGVSWFLLAIASCLDLVTTFYLEAKKQNNLNQFHTPTLYILAILMSIPLLAEITATGAIHPDKKSIDVALVQPNIKQDEKWDRRHFSRIVDILYEQSNDHWDADLIVWPEGAIPAYQHQVQDIMQDINRYALKTITDLLLGLPVYESQQDTSYAAFVSLGASEQTYHKQVLVPFGEYVPLGKWLRGLIEFLNLPMSNFSPATTTQQPMAFKDYQVIPAICYEIAYPDIVHALMEQADENISKPTLLVTVSNDAWFGDSWGPYQHMEMARMRALELGIPLVRSTNDGITAVVNARGEVLARLNRYEQTTLRYSVNLDFYETLYRKYGLFGIYFILLLSSVIFVAARVYSVGEKYRNRD
ncbi:MAG: apolipoprotein N-acyltransferase, partial [Kangiellaceae bacterium]|nr:apolipoprotein N-acyltransferase [Kangiellaceae bacterium]